MFPVIETLDDLLPHIQGKEEIRVQPQPDGTVVVCYMISKGDTFDTPWARECRGITFDANGELLCRPLHKFFNINERPDTQLANLAWGRLTRVMPKLDGSMLTPYLVNGALTWKTKKTAGSDVAKLAQKWLAGTPEGAAVALVSREFVESGLTPIYEFTHPEARIVIDYGKPAMTLLHLRDRTTGAYLPLTENGVPTEWAERALKQGVPVVAGLHLDWERHIASLAVLEQAEGFVFQFDGGEMVKGKSDWYRRLHHAVTFLRERDIARFVLDEKLDDVKAALVESDIDLGPVEAVEARVVAHFSSFVKEVETLAAIGRTMVKKDFAAGYAKQPLFTLAVKLMEGRDVPYKEYFERYMLRENYSLATLPSRVASVDLDG